MKGRMKFTPPPPILEVKRKIFFKNRGDGSEWADPVKTFSRKKLRFEVKFSFALRSA